MKKTSPTNKKLAFRTIVVRTLTSVQGGGLANTITIVRDTGSLSCTGPDCGGGGGGGGSGGGGGGGGGSGSGSSGLQCDPMTLP